jgi:hypothetical protein
MKRRIRYVVALSFALAALATGSASRAQEIPVVEVPLVTGAPLQFHALSAPPGPWRCNAWRKTATAFSG